MKHIYRSYSLCDNFSISISVKHTDTKMCAPSCLYFERLQEKSLWYVWRVSLWLSGATQATLTGKVRIDLRLLNYLSLSLDNLGECFHWLYPVAAAGWFHWGGRLCNVPAIASHYTRAAEPAINHSTPTSMYPFWSIVIHLPSSELCSLKYVFSELVFHHFFYCLLLL